MDGKLTEGERYDTGQLVLAGWTHGDGSGHESYSYWDFFDAEGRYLGPDVCGIEPLFAESTITAQ